MIDHKTFSSTLRAWFNEARRDLPWRETPRSLYKTVISEFMLQQTQVDTVLPYFHKWLERFPDFKTLADADTEEVVKYWEGLGYYSRARNLHKLAKVVAAMETIPTDPKSWRALPGVGPYTAAAITSIALDQSEAVVDGNVIRILARLTGTSTEFKDNNTAAKHYTPIAQELITEDSPGDHNEAMMELGATLCTKANPLCTVCPVLQQCEGAKQGIQLEIPKFQPRKVTQVAINRLWVEDKESLLLHRIPANAKRLANMYELPDAELLQYKLNPKSLWTTKKRGISNQRITESIYRMESPTPEVQKLAESDKTLHWVKKQDMDSVTLSGPHKRWISSLLQEIHSSDRK